MYFSHNITYFYEPIDEDNPELGRQFITLEEYGRVQYSKELLKVKKIQKQREEFFDSLNQEDFTKEELDYLKQNWVPPELK